LHQIGVCRTDTSLPVALFGFDSSGKTLAECHHRKFTRAEQSAAVFFMLEQLALRMAGLV
jgi:hypothetical protein